MPTQVICQFISGGPVNDVELPRCIDQPHLLGLAMDGHLIPNDAGQLASGNLSPSKQRSRAMTRDVSGADHLAILDCSAKLADETVIRRVKDGFDDGAITAMPNQPGVSLIAEQQTNTGHHHGLSGTGLAGDRRQRG